LVSFGKMVDKKVFEELEKLSPNERIKRLREIEEEIEKEKNEQLKVAKELLEKSTEELEIEEEQKLERLFEEIKIDEESLEKTVAKQHASNIDNVNNVSYISPKSETEEVIQKVTNAYLGGLQKESESVNTSYKKEEQELDSVNRTWKSLGYEKPKF